MNNGKRVFIGSDKSYLEPGVYIYKLTYQTTNQLGYFKDHDELYWNVTGNGWIFPIYEASAVVILPSLIPKDQLRLAGYTGNYGLTANNFQISNDFYDNPVFKTTARLNSYEGLTIAVSWPKGFIQQPTTLEKMNCFLADNVNLLLAIFGLLLSVLYYICTWWTVGKDPAAGTIIPLFKPPVGISPGEIRFIREMAYDNKCFVATLIQMAVKGIITIHKNLDTYSIKKVSLNDSSLLTPEESTIYNSLFVVGSGQEFKFDEIYYRRVQAALQEHKQMLATNCQNKYFVTNHRYLVIGVILSVIFIIPGIIDMLNNESLNYILVAIVIIIGIMHAVFYRLLKAPTLSGRRLWDRIEGFKLYLSVAEKDRLNFATPPNETPELFEKYLPFALALGVEQQWAEHFAAIFKQLSDSGNPYTPGWYNDYSGNHFDEHFVDSLSNSFSGVISAAATPPGSSSGSGGGGCSGGGGGGGGGW
jgi:uncharacterized membrane protein YgcG